MLILTRKRNQSVCIGDDIRVLVVSTSSSGVRLGFEAPAGIAVDREEIAQKKLSEPPSKLRDNG